MPPSDLALLLWAKWPCALTRNTGVAATFAAVVDRARGIGAQPRDLQYLWAAAVVEGLMVCPTSAERAAALLRACAGIADAATVAARTPVVEACLVHHLHFVMQNYAKAEVVAQAIRRRPIDAEDDPLGAAMAIIHGIPPQRARQPLAHHLRAVAPHHVPTWERAYLILAIHEAGLCDEAAALFQLTLPPGAAGDEMAALLEHVISAGRYARVESLLRKLAVD